MQLLRNPLAKLQLPRLFAEVHEELSDLVSVHAWGGHLDGAGPVEVVVAQVESQLLNHCLLEGGVVMRHVVVSGQDAALG
jgi:hypothetical protein